MTGVLNRIGHRVAGHHLESGSSVGCPNLGFHRCNGTGLQAQTRGSLSEHFCRLDQWWSWICVWGMWPSLGNQKRPCDGRQSPGAPCEDGREWIEPPLMKAWCGP